MIRKNHVLSDIKDNTDILRYEKDLLNIGKNLLIKYTSAIEAKAIVIEKIEIFDLDHDGYPEVMAKLNKPLIKTTKVFRDGEEKEEVRHDIVYLNVWLNYQGNSQR